MKRKSKIKRSFRHSSRDYRDVELTPLIDVVFLLLIFFFVTIVVSAIEFLPAWILAFLVIFLLIIDVVFFGSKLLLKIIRKFQIDKLISWTQIINFFLSTFIISVILSTIALLIGVFSSEPTVNSFWIKASGGLNKFRHPIFLAIINYPFDFLTILISVSLLRYVIAKRKWISLFALIDIILSFLLTSILYIALKIIESPKLAFRQDYGLFNLSSTHPDWPLTPILLTTFVPVLIYMSIFVAISFFLKPIARISAYLCGLLSEKENTPFLELATIISLVLATVKAFSEWPWFIHNINRILERLNL